MYEFGFLFGFFSTLYRSAAETPLLETKPQASPYKGPFSHHIDKLFKSSSDLKVIELLELLTGEIIH